MGIEYLKDSVFIIDVDWSDLFVEERVRDWCKLRYPGHPNGCPNVGKSDRCPPDAPMLYDYFDDRREVCLLGVSFDIGEHMAKMKDKHGHWTRRQTKNVLYWQAGVKKRLREEVKLYMGKTDFDTWTDTPEGMGLNVFRTCIRKGLRMKKDPDDTVYKIAMIGYGQDKRWF